MPFRNCLAPFESRHSTAPPPSPPPICTIITFPRRVNVDFPFLQFIFAFFNVSSISSVGGIVYRRKIRLQFLGIGG